MKSQLYILAIWAFSTRGLFAQEVEIKKCDVTILRSINGKIGQLTQEEIRDFLLTFGKDCNDSVEYSELSNQLLFSVLDKQPELTLQTIEKEENNIEMDEIFDDLREPMHDKVNIPALIVKVDKIIIIDRLKREIIKRLKVAESKF